MKDTVCRLCLCVLDPDDDDGGYSVLNDRFRTALENVFTFKISLEMDLPVQACKQCSWNVLDFQSFSELVKKNQEQLEKALLNVENNSAADDTGTCEHINEGNVESHFETLNSSQISDENNTINANTTPTDNEICLDDVKVKYEIHPDHASLRMLEESADKLCPDMVCEEYIITSGETENSNYNTMQTAVKQNILYDKDRSTTVEDENDISDTDEQRVVKKQKICTRECASVTENDLVSDSSSNVGVNNPKETVPVLIEQAYGIYSCELCEKKCASKWLLEYHKQEHVILKCPFCQKSLPAKTLHAHIATHQDAYSCNTCNKKFINQRQFRYHIKNDCTKRSLSHADA